MTPEVGLIAAIDDAARRALAAQEAIRDLESERATLVEIRRGAVSELRAAGWTWQQVASLLGIAATRGQQPQIADLGYFTIVISAVFFGVAGRGVAAVITALVVGPLGAWGSTADRVDWIEQGFLGLALAIVVGTGGAMLDARPQSERTLAARLAETYRKTLHAVAEAVELRDPITSGHSRRVAANARVLGDHLGFRDSALDHLYWAGLLHDVGKIAVPESILQKPGPLTEEGRTMMRSHSAIGARLVRETSPDLAEIAETILGHHEWWDGRGYPLGLAVGLRDVGDTEGALNPAR